MFYKGNINPNFNRPKGIPLSFLVPQVMNIEQPETQQDARDSPSPEAVDADGKISVFTRLGPVSAPKRPKLTINITMNKEDSVRDVTENAVEVNKLDVYKRDYIINSKNDIVQKYLRLWPKADGKFIRQMELKSFNDYERFYFDTVFYKITVTGYPRNNFTKEDVLNVIIDVIEDRNFVPCFIEFSEKQCSFLVVRCQKALTQLYKFRLRVTKENYVLRFSISKLDINVNHLDFIPRLVVRKLILKNSFENRLDLSAFCLQPDISHFVYFPLYHIGNQSELSVIESTTFKNIVELNLSNNKLTTLKGFNLLENAPKLKVLDLSNNYLERFGELICCKGLLLRSLNLEGNMLCQNFIQTSEYIQCSKMLFPTLIVLDGVELTSANSLPTVKQNYCQESAESVVSKYLEVYYPLIDTPGSDRMLLAGVYHEEAVFSISCRSRLRNHPHISYFRKLFLRITDLRNGIIDPIKGAHNIVTLLCRWPDTQHDPSTFHTDVLYHNEKSTLVRIDGVFKIPSLSLADDEPMVFFSRTVLLTTKDEVNYLIKNEMITWDAPSESYCMFAFKVNRALPRKPSLNLESLPNEELKEQLVKIFMKITGSQHSYSRQSV